MCLDFCSGLGPGKRTSRCSTLTPIILLESPLFWQKHRFAEKYVLFIPYKTIG